MNLSPAFSRLMALLAFMSLTYGSKVQGFTMHVVKENLLLNKSPSFIKFKDVANNSSEFSLASTLVILSHILFLLQDFLSAKGRVPKFVVTA